MVSIDKENLEKALGSSNNETTAASASDNPLLPSSEEEEKGFHKGALSTLINERSELLRMLHNVEIIMQSHIKRLEELGVKFQRQDKN